MINFISYKGFTSGIHYWEVILDERTENEIKVGVSTISNMDFNTAFCDFDYGFGFYAIGNNLFHFLKYNRNYST